MQSFQPDFKKVSAMPVANHWKEGCSFFNSVLDEPAIKPSTRIYLEEMKLYLSYKTRKSCRRWCQRMPVALYRDIGTLKKYALRADFTLKYTQYKVAEVYTETGMFTSVNMDKSGNRVIIDLAMDKPLHIPDELKTTGLTVYCYKCKRNVSDICRDTGKPIEECSSGNRHAFKVYVEVGHGVRKTRTLETRNVHEASKQAKEIAQKLKKGNHQEKNTNRVIGDQSPLKSHSETMTQVMERYVGFLRNEKVPWHKEKERTEEHIKDVERAMKVLVSACMEAGISADEISIYDVNDDMVGIVCKYLVEVKQFSSRTLNKYLTYYTSLFNWYIKKHDSKLPNFFQEATRDEIIPPEPVAISKQEYDALLKIIKPELGMKKYESGVKKVRNMFRSWLVPGIKLGLETGLRREQLISLRFNDIFEHTDGNFYIKSENLKSNRIRKAHRDNNKRFVYVRITDSLKKLLFELGYERHKHTNTFILAPEVELKRNRILSDTLTKGFSHYYELLGTGQKLTFKSLRKRHMTALKYTLGDNAKYVSGHSSGNGVLDTNYIDKREIAKDLDHFEIFPKENGRTHELNKIRTNKQPELTLEK